MNNQYAVTIHFDIGEYSRHIIYERANGYIEAIIQARHQYNKTPDPKKLPFDQADRIEVHKDQLSLF